MYGALRSRQAINEPWIIYQRRQRISTCKAYRAARNLPLICHGQRRNGQQSIPQYASPPWKAEQRRDLTWGAKDEYIKTKSLFCSTGRGNLRVPRDLVELERRQILSSRAFSNSPGLRSTNVEGQAETSNVYHVPVNLESPPQYDAESKTPNIRERLRRWEEANSAGAIKDVMADLPKPGQMQNTAMRGGLEGYLVEPQQLDSGEDNGTQLSFEQGELVDLGNNRPFLLRGDLVELNVSNQRQPELAICIRQSELYTQFYTMSGKWVNRNSNHVLFYVPRFVASEEVDGLLPYLPDADSSSVVQNKLQDFESALPREVGAPLVDKMLQFWSQTESAYRSFADSLDQAYQTVASNTKLQYYTLQQLAEKLIPQSAKDRHGQFPIPVLYAVHRAVVESRFGFRAAEIANHRHGSRNGGRYEVVPKIENTIADRVTDYVRKFQESQAMRAKSRERENLPLAKFITKAQCLIDLSRKNRELTKSGTLGPYKGAADQGNVSSRSSEADSPTKFTDTDIEIIRFIESWVAMRNFKADSAINGIGSLILRATRRYDDFDLDPTTAWTFLQEIGVITPWDNRVAFSLRLPKAGFQLSAETDLSEKLMQTHIDPPGKDHMETLRRDWESLPVYCIDDFSAQEIDDGVSLERIGDSLDEYWIHIHTADPASHIKPSSDIARNAEWMASSLYFPERVISMIPKDITSNLFSLANGRPSLTFSAKLNNAGDILDIKVTPGFVGNVKYITPSVVDEIVGGTAPSKKEGRLYTVGAIASGPSKSHSNSGRKMLQVNELTEEDKENLKKLSSLGLARRQKALKRGGIPPEASSLLHAEEPSISVQINEQVLPPTSHANYYKSDPTIEFRCNDHDVNEIMIGRETVTSLMLLGGEISARWCHARGISIPYRVSPQNPEKADPSTYLRETVLPALNGPGEVVRRLVEGYLYLIGRVSLSTTPGPHLALGISKYAKCTSPLRRYGDLIVHWQIEAALLEEAKTGQSLVGSTREDYLPFSRDAIEDLIPTLDARERAVQRAHREAKYSWAIQFILRAWKFKECTLPQSFECVIRQVRFGLMETVVIVRINFLGITAHLEVPEWIKDEDLQVGNAYECELSDVNFYLRKIYLKPLRRIDGGNGVEGV